MKGIVLVSIAICVSTGLLTGCGGGNEKSTPQEGVSEVATAQDNLEMAKAVRDLLIPMKTTHDPAYQPFLTTEMRTADITGRARVLYVCGVIKGTIEGQRWTVEGHWRTVFSQACDKVYGMIRFSDPYQADLYDNAIRILGDAIVAAEGE